MTLKLDRREMLKLSGGVVAALSLGFSMEGCSADEIIAILNLMGPAITGVVAIVDLVDPGVGAAVQVAVDVFTKELPVVTGLYHDFKNAAVGAKADALSKLQDELAVLRQDATAVLNIAHIKNAEHQQVIVNLVSAVESEIAEITTLIASAKAGRKMAKPVKTAAQFKKELTVKLQQKTGDAKLDATTASIAKKL